MTGLLSTLRIGRAPAALALSALMACSAQAGSRAKPINETEPRRDQTTTNLNQLTSPQRDPVQELERAFRSPFRAFAPEEDSLGPVMAPPPRPPAPSALQSKRAKELLERRRDWIFMTPEDLLDTPTVDQILKTPDPGSDMKSRRELPALERYFERLVTKSAAKDDPTKAKDGYLMNPTTKSTSPEATPESEDSELPTGLKESTEALRSLFGLSTAATSSAKGATPNSFADPFGLALKDRPESQDAAHKKLMDEYRSFVDPTWRPPTAATVASGVNPIFGLSDWPPAPAQSAPAVPGIPKPAAPKEMVAQSNPLNPPLGPAPLPDLNAHALGQPQPAPALFKDPPRRVMPGTPNFSAPRRAF